MATRPYILLRESDRAGLGLRLRSIVSGWGEEWLAGDQPELGAVTVVDTLDGADVDASGPQLLWRATDAAGDLLGLIGLPAPAELADALLGNRGEPGRGLSPVEQALLDRAVGDLCGRLRAVASERLAEDHAAHAQAELAAAIGPGAQAVRTELNAGPLRITLLLAPAAVRGLVERPPPAAFPGVVTSDRLTTLQTVEDSLMRATARLGEVEMTVKELASLRVGDVICLDTRTDEPVRVRLAGTGQTLLASLGAAAGESALQIRRIAEPDEKNQAEGSH